jgi:hypothetical protein|tara:strand:- start:3966 stop:4226 length:261 start_codon:yes stop_codon:yes gene_type:complete
MSIATATTEEISKAITQALISQGCTRRECRKYTYEFDEPIPDYDSSEDGSASWWWTGVILEGDFEEIATFSIPDWWVVSQSVEIYW